MTALTDLQMEIGGVVIGRGTQVRITEVSGLGRPPLRDSSDEDNPTDDGTLPGLDYYDARTVKIDCAVRIPGDAAACRAVVEQLQASADEASVRLVGGATEEFRVQWPGGITKTLRGRMTLCDPTWAQIVFGWVPLDLEFRATDPRFYGDEDHSITMGLGYVPGGGFSAPIVAPIVVSSGGGSTARPGWLTNEGDAPTWPVFTVAGPCSNPVITDVQSGRTIALSGTIPTGRTVTIDTRPGSRSVTWDGGGNAAGLLTAQARIDLMQLPAGTSEIRWNAVDLTNTARLSVVWRDAYKAL
jgi:hypothetical protein